MRPSTPAEPRGTMNLSCSLSSARSRRLVEHAAEHRENEKAFDELHDDQRSDDGHDVAADVGGDDEGGRPHDDSPRGIVEDDIGSLLSEPIVLEELEIEEEEDIHDEGAIKS